MSTRKEFFSKSWSRTRHFVWVTGLALGAVVAVGAILLGLTSLPAVWATIVGIVVVTVVYFGAQYVWFVPTDMVNDTRKQRDDAIALADELQKALDAWPAKADAMTRPLLDELEVLSKKAGARGLLRNQIIEWTDWVRSMQTTVSSPERRQSLTVERVKELVAEIVADSSKTLRDGGLEQAATRLESLHQDVRIPDDLDQAVGEAARVIERLQTGFARGLFGD